MKIFLPFLPLLFFLAVIGALIWRLAQPHDTEIRSQLAGNAIPTLALPAALPGLPGLATPDLIGKPHLLNLFASWCVPCVTELPLLVKLNHEGAVIVGIDIRDRREELTAFLAQNGNPFVAIGADKDSTAQMALGSSGVPETFVVDRHGVIRAQFIGGITQRQLPEVRTALRDAAR